MKQRVYAYLIVAFVGVLALSTSVGAQTTSATISGTVLDDSAGVIANARIIVVKLDTGLRRQATTE